MLVPSSRPSPYQVMFVMGEWVIMALAAGLAVYIRLGDASEILTWKYSWHRLVFVPMVMHVSFYYFDLHNFRVAKPFIWTVTRVIQAVVVGTMGLAMFYYIIPRLYLGRGVLVLMAVLVVIFVLIWRLGYGWALRQQLFSTKIILIGSGSMADVVLDELASRSDNLYQLVCLVDMNFVETGTDGETVTERRRGADRRTGQNIIPESGPNLLEYWAGLFKADYRQGGDELWGLASFHSADILVTAMSEKRGTMPLEEMLRCRMHGLPVVSGEDFFEDMAGKIMVRHIRPSWLVFSPRGFKATALQRLSKRTFDLAVSTVGLILSSPLSALTALAVKLDSKGPVLYRQTRTGQKGKVFDVYKFRSMVSEAEAKTGPVWSSENDPRITRVGRFIRKTRLDEIPQMWNVFKGDMSFVGPRPERPEFVKELIKEIPFYDERHNVKPGITGWAQVCFPYGSSVSAAMEKLSYDLYYIKNAGLGTDLAILFQTLKIILFGGGGR